MTTIQARIFRRYRMSDELFFCDAVAEGPQLLSLCFKGATLVRETAKLFSLGDLIEVTGNFDPYIELSRVGDVDARLSFSVISARLLAPLGGGVQFDWHALVHPGTLQSTPAFALQLDQQFAGRVVSYLAALGISSSISSSHLTQSGTRVVLVKDATQATADLLRRPSPLSQCIKRLFPLACQTQAVACHPDAIQAASSALAQIEQTGETQKFRVVCFPKDLARPLIDLLTDKRCCPKSFTHVLYVVFANGLFFASVAEATDRSASADIYQTTWGQKEVSRAENKLYELVQRTRISLKDVKTAVDVGAAPGGWSNFLAEEGVGRVIAVDNGDVKRLLPAVEHWRMRGEEAVESLKNQQTSLDLYVCDANIPPLESVDIFLAALPLLKEGGRFVITLKNTYRTKEAFQAAISQVLGKLDHAGIQGIELVHLIANTTKETTIYGQV